MAGRPTKLTDETGQKIVEFVKIGNYLTTSAQAAGVGERTLFTWLKKGQEAEEIFENLAEGEEEDPENYRYRQFRQAIKEAEAHGEVTAVAAVRSHWGENWQAAMTYLERRHPTKWRKRETVFNETPPPADVTERLLDDPKLRELAAEYEERLAGIEAPEAEAS